MRWMRSRASLYVALLFVIALLALPAPPRTARAVELPPPGSPIFIQTNGPAAPIGLGDWYTSDTNGIGGAYHYFSITVPCRWPRTLDYHIDLFSPEINTFGPLPRNDELQNPPIDETVFELYGPGTALNLPREPAPGAPGSLVQRVFAPVATAAERWERFYSIAAPVACGTYLLRAETRGDEQNGWRLRLGGDDDADPNNPPPANYDNPDGRVGSGDETLVGITQTTYQHNDPAAQCLTLYQFVRDDLPAASFHNFDLDTPGDVGARVTYYPPSATYDPLGALTPGAIAGQPSTNRVWNGGTQTDRGPGDAVALPEPGWWRIVTCVRGNNQFNQEGQTGVPIYRQPVPEPDMLVLKDDGRTQTAPGETLTYTISFANRSLTTRQAPGAAFDVVLRDTLPPNTTYLGCRLVTPGLAGSCAAQAGAVVFTLDEPVAAGDGGQVEVTVRVNPDAADRVVNTVSLDYADIVGNAYPTLRAEDIDTIPAGLAPALQATKEARLKQDPNRNGIANPGELIEYTIAVTNSGSGAAFDVTVDDTPDQHTTLVAGSVVAGPGGTVLAGNAPADRSVSVRFDQIPAGATAQVVFDVTVNSGIPSGVTELVNQGTIGGSNVPGGRTDDPGEPGPSDKTRVPYQGPGGGTAITLLDLRAERSGVAVELRWLTGTELGTAGFHLYRATSDVRSEAVRVTPALVPARGGPAGGAAYRWVDEAAPDGPVFYWLVEVERDGDTGEHGPVAPASPAPNSGVQIFLPML